MVKIITRNNRNLTDNDIPQLIKEISKIPEGVDELHLQFNEITSQGAKLLAMLNNVRLLNLAHNNLDDECLAELAKSEINVLDLNGNHITDKGIDSLITDTRQKSIHVPGLWVSKKKLALLVIKNIEK